MTDHHVGNSTDEFSHVQKLFLCGADVKHFNWEVLLCKLHRSYNDCLSIQERLLELTVNHPQVLKYPPRLAYRRAFLKTLISKIEDRGLEVAERVYSAYCGLLSDETAETHYRHYLLEGEAFITLRESTSFISQGTTGLCSWQGAFALAEWCLGNKAELCGRNILELGCGVGLTGLAVSRCCQPRSYTFSDCHPAVLAQLWHNIRLNPCPPTTVSVANLDWANVKECPIDVSPDIILAADVVYDKSIFAPLRDTLNHFLSRPEKVFAVIACTVRNLDTLQEFLYQLESVSLRVSEEPVIHSNIFFFLNDPPIKIIRVANQQKRDGSQ